MSSTTTAFKRRHLWLLTVTLLVIWCISGVDSHTLRLRVQPGRALGGEAFGEQPQVEILEGDGGDVDVLFQVRSCVQTEVIAVLYFDGSTSSSSVDVIDAQIRVITIRYRRSAFGECCRAVV